MPGVSDTPGHAWPAIAAAQRRHVPRVPLHIIDGGQALPAGSVARDHLGALARWPQALRVDETGVALKLPAAERSAFFAEANAALREAGLILAWRDETYPLPSLTDGRLLATLERAASRFWGTLTFGAHCNGCLADGAGRPTHLWIARRSLSKPTDPGRRDNLIGGGVPHGQTPTEAVLREGWEEAGLLPEQMSVLQRGRVIHLARDIAEGFQREDLSVFDLALPAGLIPRNQDGEVASIELLPIDQALALAAGDEMTVDAALVMLDFALRHRLLPEAEHRHLAQASAALWATPARP